MVTVCFHGLFFGNLVIRYERCDADSLIMANPSFHAQHRYQQTQKFARNTVTL